MAGMQSKPTRLTHARDLLALLTTGTAYWLVIFPRASREVRRWESRARQIPDATLRAQALGKLTSERLNPEAAAFFAVLAPRRRRARLIRLIVAFQIMYDYLDAVNEQAVSAHLRNGLQLHRALSDAVSARSAPADYYRHHPQQQDGGYLLALVHACREVLEELPSTLAVEPLLAHAAERCGEAQSRNHSASVEGEVQLADWTSRQDRRGEYRWWELAAGGISCLSLHALFAAAASRATREDAAHIDAVYFPSICAISAMLDSLVDFSADACTENHSFVAHYATGGQAAERFVAITSEARTLLRALPGHRRHLVILAGIATFYLSAPEAQGEFARPITADTLGCLGPITKPTFAAMRLRRGRRRVSAP